MNPGTFEAINCRYVRLELVQEFGGGKSRERWGARQNQHLVTSLKY
jgi:hypothetical protein